MTIRPDLIAEAEHGVFARTYIDGCAMRVEIEFRYSTHYREWNDTWMGGDEPYATIGWWYGVLADIAGRGTKQVKRVRNGAARKAGEA